MPRYTLVTMALVIASLVWPACTPAGSTAAANSGKAAPDFTLSDSQGAPIRLSDYKGKVVLLDFWATWCGGCKTEIPWYIEFENRYKNDGLTVIGVSMDDGGWKTVKPFLEQARMNYPVVIGNDDLAKLYGLTQMPMTLLIDRDGKIAESHVGVVNKDAFESEIRTLLHKSSKNAAG